MDIRKKRVFPIGVLHLKDAAGDLMYAENEDGSPDLDRPCRVRLHGPGSPKFVACKQQIERDALENGKNANEKEKARGQDKLIDDIVTGKRRIDWLVKITDGWENIELTAEKGEMLTGENLSRAIYEDIALGFLTDQCDVYTVKWANFTKGLPAA